MFITHGSRLIGEGEGRKWAGESLRCTVRFPIIEWLCVHLSLEMLHPHPPIQHSSHGVIQADVSTVDPPVQLVSYALWALYAIF
jgi:hypothetical protein